MVPQRRVMRSNAGRRYLHLKSVITLHQRVSMSQDGVHVSMRSNSVTYVRERFKFESAVWGIGP
jgi:hypothetical protein